MFQIQKVFHKKSQLDSYQISNQSTSCIICPSLGGSIQELTSHNKRIINGVNFNDNPITEYATFYNSSILFPFAGRIENGQYTYNKKQFQLPINEPERNNALHGFLFDKVFTIVSKNTTENLGEIVLKYRHNGIDSYPFPFDFFIKYTLQNNSLQVEFKVCNTGNTTMPFGIGWHPYFATNNLVESTLQFNAKTEVICNDKMIPTQQKEVFIKDEFQITNTNFDTTYLLNEPGVYFKTNEYYLKMQTRNTGDSYLQLFTPFERNCIAIEPMTCTPNIFNHSNGLQELKPNENYLFNINLEYEVF